MNVLKFCPAFLVLACTAVASAGERHPETAPAVLLASADSVPTVRLGSAVVEAKPESAGVADALPDLPQPTTATSAFLAIPAATVSTLPAAHRETYSETLPKLSTMSLVRSSPLAGAARLVGAQHFNTQDGSSVDAFAICYRLSKRSSVQVIPGDPAPVKIPVSSMANNTGVTVGMVLRLRK